MGPRGLVVTLDVILDVAGVEPDRSVTEADPAEAGETENLAGVLLQDPAHPDGLLQRLQCDNRLMQDFGALGGR